MTCRRTGIVATAQISGARDYQEDTLAVQRLQRRRGPRANELLLVLADGMGGHAGGEMASRLVVDCFCAAYSSSPKVVPEALRSSLDAANECLADAVLDAPELRGMGATLVGCVIRENSLYWVSVGDSPLWVCRGRGAAAPQCRSFHGAVAGGDGQDRRAWTREEALEGSAQEHAALRADGQDCCPGRSLRQTLPAGGGDIVCWPVTASRHWPRMNWPPCCRMR